MLLRLIVLLTLVSFHAKAQVSINEAMCNNDGAHYDEDGDTPDWVELYNYSSQEIDLAGWSLADEKQPGKWGFPSHILKPNEYLIINLSGKTRYGTHFHASFKYSSREHLYLYDNTYKLISSFEPACIPQNYSYGNTGSINTQSYFSNPTPGTANDLSSAINLVPIHDSIHFSHTAGFYDNQIDLNLYTFNGAEIFYTLNGEEPDEDALEYSSPIQLKERDDEPNDFSDIKTSPEWKKPGNVAKINIIRAVAYSAGCPVSEIQTNTYLIGDEKKKDYSFPIVSIGTNKSSLFGNKKGIYVEGSTETPNYLNEGNEWERDLSFEYFNNNERVVNINAAGRIHGRFSRNKPQKSLRLYAEDTTFNYNFFPQKNISDYKRIILKTTDTHSSTTLFKDELAFLLLHPMNIDVMAWHPVIVFVNGEYWGIHNMRERQDKHYIANNFNIHPDSVIIQGISFDGYEEVEGSRESYDQLYSFIQSADLADQTVYEKVKGEIDIDNFIDYHIAELYLANYDWPRNNVRFWKKENGKWRFFFFDCDVCFIYDQYDMLVDYVRGQPKYDEYTFLLRSLLKNKEFSNAFLSRFTYAIETYFEPGHVLNLIDSCEALYSPMVHDHIDRWHQPDTYQGWKSNIEVLREFAVKRPVQMLEQLREYLPDPITVFPNPATDRVFISSSLPAKKINVILYDIKGVIAKDYGSLDNSTGTTPQISTEGLKAGVYICRIQSGTQIYTKRLIIL